MAILSSVVLHIPGELEVGKMFVHSCKHMGNMTS